jgi:hypothetical protein
MTDLNQKREEIISILNDEIECPQCGKWFEGRKHKIKLNDKILTGSTLCSVECIANSMEESIAEKELNEELLND